MAKANIGKPPRRKTGKGSPPPDTKVTHGKGSPPTEPSTTLDRTDKEPTVQMNFTVPQSFKDEYKEFGYVHRMKLLEMLFEGFRLLKEEKKPRLPRSSRITR